MNIRHRFLSGLKWSALGKAIGQLVSWGITIFVIRLLSPTDYGLMAIVMMIITLLSHFNEFGLSSALVQAKDINDEQCGAIFGAMLLLGCFFSLALAISAPLLAIFFDEPRLTPILAVAGLVFLISASSTLPESILRREMEFKSLAITDFINVISSSLGTLIFALFGYGVWALIIGNIFGATTRSISLYLISPRIILPNLRFHQCREFIGFGSYLTASRFAWWIMSQADVILGAKLLSKEALGLYSVSVHLASLPMHKAMSVINQVTFSTIAKLNSGNNAARSGLLEGFKWLGYTSFPILAGIAVTATEFVPIFLGENWTGAIIPLQLVAVAVPLRMIAAVFSTSVTALGRADVDFRNTITGILIMPAAFFLGVQWGAIGLAAAWLIGVPIVFLLNFSRISAVTGVNAIDLLRIFFPPFIATILMCLTVSVGREFFNDYLRGLLLFISLVTTGSIAYPLILIGIDRDIRMRVKNMLSRR